MKVTKKVDKIFRDKATLMILSYNAKVINEDVRIGNYRIEGKNNNLELIIDDNVGSLCFSVYSKFDFLNDLTGYMNCKHNFHTASECQNALAQFEIFLKEAVKRLK